MSKSFKITMALIALIVGVFAIFVVKAVNDTPPEPVAKEPAPATTPTVHTDPEMALTYANQRLADLKADYTRNAALYQDKDAQGLRDIRSELIDAMNANEYEYPSEMRFFYNCDQAYQALVYLNYHYLSESIHQDGYMLEDIAEKETEYKDHLYECEAQIQSSLEL